MTKQTLVGLVLADHKDVLTTRSAEGVVDSVLDGITAILLEQHELILRNFGTFRITDRPPRVGRNPQTGDALKIPASIRISFKPATRLKDVLKPKKASKRKVA